jgi:hypothetical protein
VTDLLIRRGATFGHGDALRWTLTRDWDDRLPRVCFIGHNPSTASHLVDDPTALRWTHFASLWGYGGYTAVNFYPYRSATPEDARRWADWSVWSVRDAIHQNVEIIAREAKRAGLVVACWGAIMLDEIFMEHVVEEIMTGEGPWPSIHVFGLTKSGAPIHLMARGKHRVPDDRMPVVWRVNGDE